MKTPRIPVVYWARELANWTVEEEYAPNKWRPARCCGYMPAWHNWEAWRRRFLIAWDVFCGRKDAVCWGERSGQWGNDHISYRDITDPKCSLRHNQSAILGTDTK